MSDSYTQYDEVPRFKNILPFNRCWEKPLRDLVPSFQSLLANRLLSPKELSALAKLIYAVDRLPIITEGVAVEVNLSRKTSLGEYWGGIQVYGDMMSIYSGETILGPCGSEAVNYSLLDIEVGVGHNKEQIDPIEVMIELEDWVSNWTEMCGDTEYKFDIHDDNPDFDWSQPTIKEGWGALEDGI